MYSLIKYKNISIQLVYIGGVAWFLGLFFFKQETENTWFAIQMSTACCAYDRVHRALEIVSFNGLITCTHIDTSIHEIDFRCFII